MSLILSGTDGLSDIDGSAATPAIRGTDANTGIFFPAADTIAFAEGGAEIARFDSSGNLGIGATTNNVYDAVAAGRPLVVQKSDTNTTLNGSTASITITNGDTTTNNSAQLNFAAITGASANQYSSAIISCIFGARTNTQYPTGVMTFSTSSILNAAPSEKMRITSAGNVGIGTTSPNSLLTVGTPNTQTVAVTAQFSGTSPLISSGSGIVQIGSTDAVDVDKGGVLSFTANTTTLNGYAMGFIAGKYQTAGAGVYSGYLQFGTSNSVGTIAERMRIDSSGSILMGLTSSTIGGDGGKLLIDNGSGLALLANKTSDGNIVRWYRSSSNVGNINVTTTATAYNTSSDYRLKNTIAPMIGALAKVALLKPCTYKWNADGSDGQGFIAHELDEVVPGCVSGEKDAVETYTDEEGNEATRPAYQGIDTSFLVATLTAAIQEQQALITALTARITALENT
jgi:hypothetical protein